jgi:low affinity Fe/Cu permease
VFCITSPPFQAGKSKDSEGTVTGLDSVADRGDPTAMNHNRRFRPLQPRSALGRSLENMSRDVTAFTGSAWAFAVAALIIVAWLLSGPIFHYSDTWQLVINTGTTIVTFLMVFLIQRSQNKDSLALQLKLNEIVAALPGASNRLIDVEDLTEQELRALHEHYKVLAEMAKRGVDLKESHSVEEAMSRHAAKQVANKEGKNNPHPR